LDGSKLCVGPNGDDDDNDDGYRDEVALGGQTEHLSAQLSTRRGKSRLHDVPIKDPLGNDWTELKFKATGQR